MNNSVFATKRHALRLLVFAVFTVLAIEFTSPFAHAQQCVDLFTKDVAPEGNSSIPEVRNNDELLNASARLSPDKQFKLFVQVFDNVPSMRPFAARQMLRITEANLKDHGVAYTKSITDKGGVLVITPTAATPLNKFAQDIFENYGAILQINPYLMMASHENGVFTTYKPPQGKEAPAPSLNLAWKHIADIDHLRFLRDPEFLNELRHLKMFQDLANRKQSPFYGQIFVLGKIPGDLNPHLKNSRFFYFDKIKIYHTFIKEELTILRGLIHKKSSPEVIADQAKKIKDWINLLNAISARTGYALHQYFLPNNHLVTGNVDIADYHVVATIKYDDKQGNRFSIKMPIVHSSGLYSARNADHIHRQMLWLHETARNAVKQSASAAHNFENFKMDLTVEQMISIIDSTQHALSTSTLVPPEPN